MSAPPATAVLVGLAAAAAAVGLAGPAGAEERLVTITSEGVTPSRLVVEVGDTVRFVSQDPTFAYRAESTGGPWRFDSGPTELLDGDYAVPAPLVQPGTYTYRVAQDPPFSGTVVVPGPGAAGEPTVPAPAQGAPPASSAPAVPAVPAPPGTVPETAAPEAAPAVPGQLPAPRSSRALGLPVAVAVVLLLAVASLLVRLLLAEASRTSRDSRGTGPSEGGGTLRTGGHGATRW